MLIKVLGTKCQELVGNVNKAVEETGVAAVIEKVEDNKEIEKYKITSTPALIIDENVVSTGKLLTVKEVKDLF